MNKAAQKVIEVIQKYMDEETLIWHKPFLTACQANLKSKNEYQGINRLTTGLASYFEGYQSPYWATFKQIRELGGELKNARGQGVPIIFYKKIESEEDEDDGEKRFVASHSFVFNLDLVEGIDEPVVENNNSIEKNLESERVISNYVSRSRVNVSTGSPCYIPAIDTVRIPSLGSFDSVDEYYSTFFHELAHSTGHETRLARFKTDAEKFGGKEDYSKEEVVAEYTSAMLCQECGVDNEALVKNQAAYIQGWNKYISTNGSEFIAAVSQAYKARNFVLGENLVAQ